LLASCGRLLGLAKMLGEGFLHPVASCEPPGQTDPPPGHRTTRWLQVGGGAAPASAVVAIISCI